MSFLMGNFIIQDQWENDGSPSCRERDITDPRIIRMEEMGRRQKNGGIFCWGRGPEGAVAP
jgi:hypothetical protein